jgi:hypothetical protein
VLDEQLITNTHTIGLLGAEIGGETELLEQEKAELEALERDLAKLEEADGIQQERLHPFARHTSLDNAPTISLDYDTRSAIRIPAVTLPGLEHDPEAKDVLDQVRHHLDSMQNNVEGTKNIVAALATSQAALDFYNWRRLGEAEYSQVYGLEAT